MAFYLCKAFDLSFFCAHNVHFLGFALISHDARMHWREKQGPRQGYSASPILVSAPPTISIVAFFFAHEFAAVSVTHMQRLSA